VDYGTSCFIVKVFNTIRGFIYDWVFGARFQCIDYIMVDIVIRDHRDWRFTGHCHAWSPNESMGQDRDPFFDRHLHNLHRNFGNSRGPSSLGRGIVGGRNHCWFKFIVGKAISEPDLTESIFGKG
jgi:hypothetical protein